MREQSDSIQVSVISLDHDSKNCRRVCESLVDMGIEHSVFSAVDGRKGFTPLLDGEFVDHHLAMLKRRSALTSTEVACYLSHYRLIKQAYKAGVDKLLVLEDDICFENNFKEVFDSVIMLPVYYEMVRLMGLKPKPRKILSDIAPGVKITRPVYGLLGTQGYVLNRVAMEKIIDSGGNISEPIDKFYDRYWDIDMRCFCVEPHVIWEIDQATSVVKSREKSMPISKIQKFSSKLYRIMNSIKGRLYRLYRCSQFFPSKIQTEIPGKSKKFF